MNWTAAKHHLYAVALAMAVAGLDAIEGIDFGSLPQPVPAFITLAVGWAIGAVTRLENREAA